MKEKIEKRIARLEREIGRNKEYIRIALDENKIEHIMNCAQFILNSQAIIEELNSILETL